MTLIEQTIREALTKQVSGQHPRLSPAQVAVIVDKICADTYGLTIHFPDEYRASYATDPQFWREFNFGVYIDPVLAADPRLTEIIPTVAETFGLIADDDAAKGNPLFAERKVAEFRKVQAMSDEERTAAVRGLTRSPPEDEDTPEKAQNPSQVIRHKEELKRVTDDSYAASVVNKKFDAMSDHERVLVAARLVGKPTYQVLASDILKLRNAMARSVQSDRVSSERRTSPRSREERQLMTFSPGIDAQNRRALANLEAKPANALTSAEKIALHRLRQICS